MRVIVIRHHDIDDAGFIAASFAARGADLQTHLVPDDGPLPDLAGADHIVVLGAVWSVYDNEQIGDWIDAELAWLREADAAGIPVLGICFGAQALAAAFGGSVERAPRPEIGWLTVESLEPGLIEPGPWLEFHFDRCVVPPGARVLATSEVSVQAFTVGKHLAVQFHPEVDADQVRRWLDGGGAAEAERAGQDPAELIAVSLAQPAASGRADRLVAAALRLATGLSGENPVPEVMTTGR